jgi:hypothetical protein
VDKEEIIGLIRQTESPLKRQLLSVALQVLDELKTKSES